MLALALLGVIGCGGADVPTPVATTAASRAALLAGNYALTISLDERCTQLPPVWTYRATLDDAGGYISVRVIAAGESDSTNVGQVYTFPDFTARVVWNFAEPDFDYPHPPRIDGPRLLLYGASDSKIVNGTITGMITGTASTTLDFNARCYGSHRFTLISNASGR
jgi:hypothetical protein